jgi:ribosomal protein S18 acetylase RimI-like enzyme
MAPFTIRKVLPEDYKTLAEFGRKTFYDTWKDYNTESDMQIYLQKAFDEDIILTEIKDSLVNTFLFAFDVDKLVAYAKVRNDRAYDEFNGAKALEVERVYVLKEYHGKPVGRMLMDECLTIAERENYEWIWLGVNIDNHRAIAFYKKYGFVTFGTKMFKLGDAEDQDFLMKRKVVL